MQAVARRDLSAVSEILSHPIDVNEQRGFGWQLGVCFVVSCSGEGQRFGETALIVAVDADSRPMVEALLAHGARVDLRDSTGRDALTHALALTPSADSEAIVSMLSKKAGNSIDESTLINALYRTVTLSDIERFRMLLPQIKQDSSIIPAMCAAASSTSTTANEMLALFQQRLGRVPNEVGSCAGSLTTIAYLLDRGLDPNAQDLHGRTLLAQHVQLIDPAIDSSCDPAQLEEVYIVQLLLQHGADPTRRDANGNSALLQAQNSKRPRIEELLTTGRIRGTGGGKNAGECPPPRSPTAAAPN